MTTKKYVRFYVIFALLLVLAVFSFFCGVLIKDHSLVAFIILIVFACLCLVFAIGFIAINYKALVNYDVKKLNETIKNLEFSIINAPVAQNELQNKLIKRGYVNENGIFHKAQEEDCCDGSIVNHYYAMIHEADETIHISTILEHFSKGFTTYNFGFIIVNNNIEKNIEILKEYVKATILDVKAHAYNYKTFFTPIVIANKKIYYIKGTGVFMDNYKQGVVEGIRIIDDK